MLWLVATASEFVLIVALMHCAQLLSSRRPSSMMRRALSSSSSSSIDLESLLYLPLLLIGATACLGAAKFSYFPEVHSLHMLFAHCMRYVAVVPFLALVVRALQPTLARKNVALLVALASICSSPFAGHIGVPVADVCIGVLAIWLSASVWSMRHLRSTLAVVIGSILCMAAMAPLAAYLNDHVRVTLLHIFLSTLFIALTTIHVK
jgi:hypothetical protein